MEDALGVQIRHAARHVQRQGHAGRPRQQDGVVADEGVEGASVYVLKTKVGFVEMRLKKMDKNV